VPEIVSTKIPESMGRDRYLTSGRKKQLSKPGEGGWRVFSEIEGEGSGKFWG